jgi:adenylate cyclase
MTADNPFDLNDSTLVLPARRAAVLFADVVGYSSLMAADDRRTYLRWMARLRGVVQPAIEAHGGRVVQLAGDGVVAEFAEAQAAVACARIIQATLKAMREAEPDQPPMAMRIAVHVGDVFVQADALFGSTMNLAARLQAQAVPGGIVLSATAQEAAGEALGEEVRDLGALQLKGFDGPVRAFELLGAAMPEASAIRSTRHILPSIAVLPLRNLTGDPAQDYFSEGVVEDVIVSLAALHELLVIARGSTLAFAGREVDPREVGRTLGVGYVLTGSFRRAGEALRISVTLYEAETGSTIWTEKLELERGALFAVQDRLVERVVAGIAPQVRSVEMQRAMRKRPESMTAYDHLLRALHGIDRLDRETFPHARSELQSAIAEDPGFAAPYAWAARWHSLNIGQGWSSDAAADADAAEFNAREALLLHPDYGLALAAYGHVLAYLRRDPRAALPHFERALIVSPNLALAWTLSSATLAYLERGAEAIQHAEHGVRLSPSDRSRYIAYHFVAVAHYAAGNYDEAIRWAQRAYDENPKFTSTIRTLAPALAAAGRITEARILGERLRELEPNFSLARYARSRILYARPEKAKLVLDHMRLAGFPE